MCDCPCNFKSDGGGYVDPRYTASIVRRDPLVSRDTYVNYGFHNNILSGDTAPLKPRYLNGFCSYK